jgi:hypothetical protein
MQAGRQGESERERERGREGEGERKRERGKGRGREKEIEREREREGEEERAFGLNASQTIVAELRKTHTWANSKTGTHILGNRQHIDWATGNT